MSMKLRRLLAWSLFVLNFLDTATTYYCVKHLHMRESNPLMAPLVSWSPEAFVALKLLAGVGVLIVVLKFGKISSRVLALVAIVYLLAVCNNAVGLAIVTRG